MAFTVEQARTVAAWRESGYQIRSQTYVVDGSYYMVIGRLGVPGVKVRLTPNGRFEKASSVTRALSR